MTVLRPTTVHACSRPGCSIDAAVVDTYDDGARVWSIYLCADHAARAGIDLATLPGTRAWWRQVRGPR